MLSRLGGHSLSIFFLGVSSGLPLLLVFGTLSYWLGKAGVERSTIGFLSWVGLSYGFKFIWAPLVDNLPLPFLTRRFGRRRAWMLASQATIVISILWMSLWDPQLTPANLVLLSLGAVVLAFASATQDIVIDAYRIDVSQNDEQALMAGIVISGYRVGMILAGAGVLEILSFHNPDDTYQFSSWSFAYRLMALLMIIGFLTTLIIKEPKSVRLEQRSESNLRLVVHFVLTVSAFAATFFFLGSVKSLFEFSAHFGSFVFEALRMLTALMISGVIGSVLCRIGLLSKEVFYRIYVDPFSGFFEQYGRLAIWLLMVICLYRTSDIVMGVMAKVFYADMGYTAKQIGRISFAFGLAVSLCGGILGGMMAFRFGVLKILMLGAVTSALSNVIFIYLARLPEPSTTYLALAIVADNLSGGLAGGVAVAFLSTLVSRRFSATQYAAFSSIALLMPKLMAGYSGTIIDATDYESFFLITALMGIPAILLIIKIWTPYKELAKK